MPSRFAEALGAAEPLFDEHIGETLTVVPMKNGDYGMARDPDRAPFDVVGLEAYVDPATADVGRLQARYAYEETEFEIRRALLAGRVLRKDDQVVLSERSSAPRYKVSRVDDVDPERIGIVLTRLTGNGSDVPGA